MKSIEYTIEDRFLLVGGRRLEFDFPIRKAIQIHDKVFVLLEPEGAAFNENVFAIDGEGRIVWQVPHRKPMEPTSPYTDLGEAESGALALYNWDGWETLFSTVTGKQLGERYQK